MSIEAIIIAAQRHGDESEPDQEVGDLQEVLRLAWEHMDEGAKVSLWRNVIVQDLIDMHGG